VYLTHDEYEKMIRTESLYFIITVDEKIAVGSIVSLKFEAISATNKTLITGSYYPGSLSLTENDYSRIMSDSTKTIRLKFTYYEYVGKNQVAYSYDIELKKEWLNDFFNILHIYNLNKEKYKARYVPREVGKSYVYELQSPTHTFKLIERKNQ
jgi:hypothetical protein